MTTTCLITVPHAGEHYAVRWRAEHPLGAYAVLEAWLREGVVDVREFGALLGCVGDAASAVKEVRT